MAAAAAAAALAVAASPSPVHVQHAPSTPEAPDRRRSRWRSPAPGSTFDAPFFTAAFAAYQQAHLGVAVSYAAVGSSAGITRFAAGQVGFGATDVPASPADLAGASGPTVQVPVDLGAVVVAYNVITNGSGPLRLTGPVIARIFLGQITKWDDPAIQALNPGTELPDAYINVVHRSDGSGTTYIFSNYLSSVSPAWAAAVGTGRSLRWPAGIGADGNAGVAAEVARIPYSIGTRPGQRPGPGEDGTATRPTRTAAIQTNKAAVLMAILSPCTGHRDAWGCTRARPLSCGPGSIHCRYWPVSISVRKVTTPAYRAAVEFLPAGLDAGGAGSAFARRHPCVRDPGRGPPRNRDLGRHAPLTGTRLPGDAGGE